MTFQPPPPPPPQGPPPPPPPGQWGPPPGQPPAGGGGGSFDPKSVNSLDWGILGAGVIAFLFSFISFYDGGDVSGGGHTVTISGGDYSFSAWHEIFGGGFFGWFAMVFAVVGAVALALQIFQPNVKLPIESRLLTVYGFLAAAVFEIIAIFVTPGDSAGGYSVSLNHGFGFWLSLIVILAGAVLSLIRAQQTSTALPGPLNNIPKIGK